MHVSGVLEVTMTTRTLFEMRSFSIFFVSLLLAGCGHSTNCNDACNKIKSCNLSSSGLSCDASCGSPDDACAACVNGTACADITSGKCATSCPNATFHPI